MKSLKYIYWILATLVISIASYILIFYQEFLIFKIIGGVFAIVFLFLAIKQATVLKMGKNIKDNNVKRTRKKLTIIDYIFMVLLILVFLLSIFTFDNKIVRIVSSLIIITSLVFVNIRDYLNQ